jgi:hypothetical protein
MQVSQNPRKLRLNWMQSLPSAIRCPNILPSGCRNVAISASISSGCDKDLFGVRRSLGFPPDHSGVFTSLFLYGDSVVFSSEQHVLSSIGGSNPTFYVSQSKSSQANEPVGRSKCWVFLGPESG